MANNGDSFIHHARPSSKVIITIILLTAVILSDSLLKTGLILLYVITAILLSRVSLGEILHLAVYPVFFSVVFGLLKLQESVAAGVLVMLKALGAALSMLLMISTTSYTDIFAVLSLVMPGIIVDVFIFTYRSLFILLDKMENLFRSIRLRGRYHALNLFSNLKNAAGALGVIIIHSFDMSDRLYRIYSLRGYKGRIPLTCDLWPLRRNDYLLMALAALLLTGVVIPWSI